AASLIYVFAGDFKVYTGAKVDDKLTREANEMAAKAQGGSKIGAPKATIYVPGDPYEKVYGFYQGVGKEYQMPGVSGKTTKLSSGMELKTAFFIFDGAKDLMSSKRWAKIQRPYLGLTMEEGPDMTYIIVSEK
ncbi:MAG TPA: hypothetical protein VLR91_10425, partial [Thermodesulfobacteriota bacterium]|nr:hypothetical protein [Thermodesulfobacteriota bacterium]